MTENIQIKNSVQKNIYLSSEQRMLARKKAGEIWVEVMRILLPEKLPFPVANLCTVDLTAPAREIDIIEDKAILERYETLPKLEGLKLELLIQVDEKEVDGETGKKLIIPLTKSYFFVTEKGGYVLKQTATSRDAETEMHEANEKELDHLLGILKLKTNHNLS